MSLEVRCPDCGHKFKMVDDRPGKTVRCKECGEPFPLDRRAIRDKPSRERTRDGDDDRPRSPRRRDRNDDRAGGQHWWWIGGGGAAAAIAAAVVIVIVASQGGEDEKTDNKAPQPLVVRPKQTDGDKQPKQPTPEQLMKLADKAVEKPKERPPEKPPLPALAPWTARPDPGQEAMVSPKQMAAIPFVTNFTHFVFPTNPSPFVTVHHGRPANFAYGLFDLHQGKQITSGTLKASLDRAILSPDGKLLATIDGKVDKAQGLRTFSTADGKEVSAVGVRVQSNAFDMEFVGNEHVITIGGEHCQVWDVTKGVKTTEFQLEARHFAHAPSPGGAYYAFYAPKKNAIQLREALTGKVVGELRLPPGEKDVLEPRKIAFSPDGQEVGCIARFGVAEKRYQILTWKMSTGELVNDHTLGSTGPNHFLAHSHDPGAFQWLPDRNGWVIAGRAWIDAESGEPVHEITPRFGHLTQLNRLVGKDHMTTVVEQKGPLGSPNKSLVVMPLPTKVIAAGVAKARGPGQTLGAAKPGDLASTRKLQADGPDQWVGLAADPPPAARAQLAPQPLRLNAETGNLHEVLFSTADVGQAVVLTAVPIHELSVTRRLRADRIDLATGNVLGGMDLLSARKLEMPRREDPNGPPVQTGAGPIKAALSPDGNRMLVRQRAKPGRIDLFDLKDNKHLTGWLPGGDETKAVEWFAFLDSSHVLTSGGGKLVLWKAPDCQAIYVVEGVLGGAALSPGRKYVAFTTAKQLVVLDALTGESKGRVSMPGAARPAVAPLFRHDGAQLAASFSEGGTTKFMRWALDSGRPLGGFESTQSAQPIFAGDHTLLLGAHLCQFNLKRPLGEYYFREVDLLVPASPDDRLWWIHTGPSGAELVAQAPVHPQLIAFSAAAAGGDVQKLPEPGKQVQVEVATNPNLAKIAQDAAEQRLRSLKFPVGKAGYWLRLKINCRDTGQQIMYELTDLSGQKTHRGVPAVVADTAIMLIDDRGATVHQRSLSIGPPLSFMTAGDDLRGAFSALNAEVHLWLARKLELPDNLYRIGGRPVLLPVQLQLAGGP